MSDWLNELFEDDPPEQEKKKKKTEKQEKPDQGGGCKSTSRTVLESAKRRGR